MSDQATQDAQPETVAPVTPAVQSESAQPEQVIGTEGTEQVQEETPEKKESRRKRQLNRERDRRIAAETELRLLKESQQKQQTQAVPVKQDTGVDPDAPTREQFGSYEDYIRADARYTAKKEAASAAREVLEGASRKQAETTTQAAQQKQQAEWEKQVDSARDEIEDFDEVCKDSDAPLTKAMGEAILESDVGARISYYLAKHPEEAERIAKLKPSRQAAEIVALEAKVAKPAKAPSKAPAPIDPVGRKADSTTVYDTRDPKTAEKLDTDAWIKLEKERMHKAGIRP